MFKCFLPFLLLFFVSCDTQKEINGHWKLDIELQKNKILPVLIYLERVGESKLEGYLVNSGEKLQLKGKIKNGKFKLDIGAHYSVLKGRFENNKLIGQWIRTNKSEYNIPFSGVKTSQQSLYVSHEEQNHLLSFAGNWKIDLGDDKYGLGIFEQKGSRVRGSILTQTGDYRYLDGFLSQNNLTLYGFDGVFSFIFELIVKKDAFVGTMFSGKSYVQKISGTRDESFALKDPNTLTKIVSKRPIRLKSNTVLGKDINLNSGEYKDKPKIVQIFGSWCPNCIDETEFFLKWKKNNPVLASKVQFLAVSFEKAPTKEKAIRDLKKFKTKMNMDYDLVLADFNGEVKPEDLFPIEKVIAFPTTLFLDAKNNVVKIHTGFAGQATGEVFNSFTKEFEQTMLDLIQ